MDDGCCRRHRKEQMECGATHVVLRQVANPKEKHGRRRGAIKEKLCNESVERCERGAILPEPTEVLTRGPLREPGQVRIHERPIREDCRQGCGRLPQSLKMEMEKYIQPENQNRAKKKE